MTEVLPPMLDDEAWATAWASSLNHDLREAAASVAGLLNREREPRTIGIIPAVYFPKLRMGTVMYSRWEAGSEDVITAFPWGVPATALPPPYGCYVPRLEDLGCCLISHVAALLDPVIDGRATTYEGIRESSALQGWWGASSWVEGTDLFVLDELYLLDPALKAVTTLLMLPSNCERVSYVPLFYIQSNEAYDPELLVTKLKTVLSQPFGGEEPISRAMRAVAHSANVRAEAWLNPKTGLLSQRGLEVVERDVRHRVMKGHSFAKLFFDIDHFKALNDEIGYAAADVVARRIADAVLKRLQDDVDDEFVKRIGAARDSTGRSAPLNSVPLPVPDAFRAFVGHVSGDEFKLFVRLDSGHENPAEQLTSQEQDRLHHDRVAAVADSILEAVPRQYADVAADDRSSSDERADTLSRALRERFVPPPRRKRLGATKIAAKKRQNERPLSISMGVARLEVTTIAEAKEDPTYGSVKAGELDQLDEPLRTLDTLSERALEAAKNRGRGRAVASDEVLPRGGIIVERLDQEFLLSLGQVDGVEIGMEFDVYRESNAGVLAESARVAQEERRAFRKLPSWVARIQVHQVASRDSLAHVVNGAVEELHKNQWLRRPGPPLDSAAIVKLCIR
jgi:GGDEF domain-containing protein